MKSDVDYAETTKRVLFSSNKKDEINRTEDITTNNKCFDWKAYLRVSLKIDKLLTLINQDSTFKAVLQCTTEGVHGVRH